jgi:hypothetical protein
LKLTYPALKLEFKMKLCGKLCLLILYLHLELAFSNIFNAEEWDYDNPGFCGNSGTSGCNTKVSIKCRVTESETPGISKGDDCLNTITNEGRPKVEPFYQKSINPGEECPYTPIGVKYKFFLCNKNDEHKIALNATEAWVRYDGINVNFSKGNIAPQKCKKIVLKRTLDLCDVNKIGIRTNGVEAQLHGSMLDGNGDRMNDFCYCYTYKRSTYQMKCNGELTSERICSIPTPNPPTMSPIEPPSEVKDRGRGKGKGKGKKH